MTKRVRKKAKPRESTLAKRVRHLEYAYDEVLKACNRARADAWIERGIRVHRAEEYINKLLAMLADRYKR